MSKIMLKKILTKVTGIEARVNNLESRMATKKDLEGMATKKDLEKLATNENLDRLLLKVVEMDHYQHENLATKDELRATGDRLLTHIDGFVKLHQTVDIELVSLQHKYHRLEKRLKAR